jgi:hypothetical protein
MNLSYKYKDYTFQLYLSLKISGYAKSGGQLRYADRLTNVATCYC